MKIHRIYLFRPYPLQNVLTLEAKAVCPVPCAVQTFQLVGPGLRAISIHVVWDNYTRGVASMAFVPPDAPDWAEDTVHRIIETRREESHRQVGDTRAC